jgi:putative ABC transport system ATP-binding protein
MALFQTLNREGMTIILVTHEPDVARFAGRILRFLDGALVEDTINPQPDDAHQILAALPPVNTIPLMGGADKNAASSTLGSA